MKENRTPESVLLQKTIFFFYSGAVMERFTDTDAITVKVTTVTKTELKKRTKRRYH